MKVYIVIDYEVCEILSVFKTKEKAKEFVGDNELSIEECEVIE